MELFWVDFDGAEQAYHTAQPQETVKMATFDTHAWRARVRERCEASRS